MYLAHGVLLKLLTFGLPSVVGFFESLGLPGWLAYITVAAEAVGRTMLMLGIYGRWVAVALTPTLIGAIIWVHAAGGWPFNAPNGGWEYPAYLIVLSIAQFLLGDDRFAMRPSSLTIAHR
ncbi:DoxX family protein [Rhizobium sp. P28RR-XV]|uniref:DoxX family protein n=1 Tax=Rhizobium sp. P28RR-XV TaxID=2726737 RepID=UPI001456F414|nr:DoxX family protein [Rhizobium sp. P28RR-XV]NLR89531.1 DoxX family protein [Rhizobium sp. P28RR-XV]